MWKVIALPLLLYLLYVCLYKETSELSTQALAITEVVYPSTTVKSYVERHAAYAIQEMHRCKIPASITLAQAILESNCGRSRLATLANNHFGIKSEKKWDNSDRYCIYSNEWLPTASKMVRVLSCFRKYSNTADCFKAHSDFIKNRAHYAALFTLDSYDYRQWSLGLKKAGYATDPDYAHKLIQIIEQYQLHQYDSKVKL